MVCQKTHYRRLTILHTEPVGLSPVPGSEIVGFAPLSRSRAHIFACLSLTRHSCYLKILNRLGETSYRKTYAGRFRLKGVAFSFFRYMKRGRDFTRCRHAVYERVGKSVISVCKKAQKGLTDAFYGCDKVRENILVFYLFIFKEMHSSNLCWYEKRVPFVNRTYETDTFCVKNQVVYGQIKKGCFGNRALGIWAHGTMH